MERGVRAVSLPAQVVPGTLSEFWHRAGGHAVGEVLCGAAVGAAIALYTVAYSSLSVTTYRTGRSLFDLALFEQSFWNAARGRFFLVSLEVTRPDLVAEMSHFGRHFSPILFILLPVYLFHQHPSTLLVLQSLALGTAAIPLYLFGRERLKSPFMAMVIALLYLANPAIHDVNLVNEFHELSFVVPVIFLAFYAIETERRLLFGIAVLGMLAVKEDVALTVCAFGVYLVLVTAWRRLGIVTIVAGILWFFIVALLVIPAFRGPNSQVPYLGYDYLGSGLLGIIRGLLLKPQLWWHVVTSAAKLHYVFWLLIPVSFIVVFASEVLIVALPATLIILTSTFPLTYALFAHYVAPVVPVVFIAAVIAVGRLQQIGRNIGRIVVLKGLMSAMLLLSLVAGTAYAQVRLHKLPSQVIDEGDPDARAATAIALVEAIPENASVVVEDHRWLAHAANRRYLYFLFDESPEADYVLINPSNYPPITNVHKEVREAAVRRIASGGNYLMFQCSDGFSLYVRKDAYARDEPALVCAMTPSLGTPGYGLPWPWPAHGKTSTSF